MTAESVCWEEKYSDTEYAGEAAVLLLANDRQARENELQQRIQRMGANRLLIDISQPEDMTDARLTQCLAELCHVSPLPHSLTQLLQRTGACQLLVCVHDADVYADANLDALRRFLQALRQQGMPVDVLMAAAPQFESRLQQPGLIALGQMITRRRLLEPSAAGRRRWQIPLVVGMLLAALFIFVQRPLFPRLPENVAIRSNPIPASAMPTRRASPVQVMQLDGELHGASAPAAAGAAG